MSRRKIVLMCLVALGLVAWIILVTSDPCFWVRKGMSYEEVESILGKQLRGLRPLSMDDNSWTGLWSGRTGIIEVAFDSQEHVRESPSYARRILDWIGI